MKTSYDRGNNTRKVQLGVLVNQIWKISFLKKFLANEAKKKKNLKKRPASKSKRKPCEIPTI